MDRGNLQQQRAADEDLKLPGVREQGQTQLILEARIAARGGIHSQGVITKSNRSVVMHTLENDKENQSQTTRNHLGVAVDGYHVDSRNQPSQFANGISGAEIQEVDQRSFLTPVQHARLQIRPAELAQTPLEGTMPAAVSDVGQSDVLNQILEDDQHSQMVVQSLNSPGFPSHQNDTKFVMNFGTEDNKYESQYLNQSVPNSQMGRDNSRVPAPNTAGSMGASLEQYQGSMQDIISNAGDDPQRLQQPQIDLKQMHQITRHSRRTACRYSVDRQQIQSGGNSQLDTPLGPINGAAMANRNNEHYITGFRPSRDRSQTSDRSIAAAAKSYLHDQQQVGLEAANMASGLIDQPEEPEEYLKHKAEVENISFSVETKVRKSVNSQDYSDFIYPESKIQALKMANKKRLDEHQERIKKLRRTSQSKVDKYINDSHMRQTNQLQKRMEYDNVKVDFDNRDGVITERIVPSNHNQSPVASSKVSDTSKPRPRRPTSNLNLYDCNDTDMDNLHEFADSAFQSNESAVQNHPFVKLTTHDQQFFSTFFNMSGKASEQKAPETKMSFFDGNTKHAAHQGAAARKPSLMNRRSNDRQQLPLSTRGDYEGRVTHLARFQDLRNTNKSHLVQQHDSLRHDKAVGSLPVTASNSAQFSFTNKPSRIQSNLRSSLERAIQFDQNRLKNQTPILDASYMPTAHQPIASEKYIHSEVRNVVYLSSYAKQKEPTNDQESLLSNGYASKQYSFREMQRDARGRRNKQRTIRELSTQMYFQNGADLEGLGFQYHKMNQMIESGKIDLNRPSARSKLKSKSVMERIQELQNVNAQQYCFSPQQQDGNEERGFVSAQARDAARRPFDSRGKKDMVQAPTKNKAHSTQMNHSDQIQGANTRRETVDTLHVNSQEASLLNLRPEQMDKHQDFRQSNLAVDETPLDFDLLWRKSRQQMEDPIHSHNQSARNTQTDKIMLASSNATGLDHQGFGKPFSQPIHDQESVSHAPAKELLELEPHTGASQPPLTQRDHANAPLHQALEQPSQTNSALEVHLGQIIDKNILPINKDGQPNQMVEGHQTKLIGKSTSEAEYVDAYLLQLDTASLQPSRTGSKSQMEKDHGVVAKSFEISVLQRALKNELKRIRHRVEKQCLVPKRNERRNFSFGKKDIVHEQLMRDIKENRKYHKHIVAARSKILKHENDLNREFKKHGVHGSQQLPKQFFQQLHNLDSKRPENTRTQNINPPEFKFDMKFRASSVKDRQQLSVDMYRSAQKKLSEARDKKSLSLLKSPNLSAAVDEKEVIGKKMSSPGRPLSTRKSSQYSQRSPQKTSSPISRLNASPLKLPALANHFQIDLGPATKHGSAQQSLESGEESLSSSTDSDCFVTSVQGGNANVYSQSNSTKALSNHNSYRSKEANQKKSSKKERLSKMTSEELQDYQGRKKFNKFMKILDQWAQTKKEQRTEELRYYQQKIRNWQFDHRLAEKNALFEFGKLNTSLDIMVEVMAYIQLKKQEGNQREVEKANHVLHRIQKYVKDEPFRKQLQDADADTRKYINQLLLDVSVDNDAIHVKGSQEAYEERLMQRDKEESQHARRPEFLRQFTVEANNMLEVVKNSLLRSVDLNRKMQSKVPAYKLKGLRVDKIFLSNAKSKETQKKLRADRRAQARRYRQRLMLTGKEPSMVIEEETSSSDSDENAYKGQLLKFGEATNKFRHIVAKRFLSKTVKQLEGSELNSVSPLMIFGLMSFKSALFKVMPQDMCKDLGKKYQFLGFNKWKNEYLRDFVHRCKTPQLEQFYGVSSVDLYVDNNIVDQREKTFKEEDLNLNKLFQKNVSEQMYYQQIKKGYLVDRELKDGTRRALMEYHDKNSRIKGDRYESVGLDLLHFGNNILYFFSKNIGITEANAFSEFLLQVKDFSSRHVHKLAIEGCNISDEAAARVLTGLEAQTSDNDHGGVHKEQHLCSIVYGNNTQLGERAFAQLLKMAPCLSELFINNIKQPAKNQQALIQSLLTCFEEHGQYLMKLRFSNVDLSYEAFAPTINSLLQSKSTLQHLDLSLARLEPKQLEEISFELKNSSRHLKNLNLSYNYLDYSNEEMEATSNNFIDNICEFVSQAEILNHINLSGMRIPREKLVQLCDHMKRSERISAIHLNNCGITDDEFFMQEILQMFGLDRQDIPVQRRPADEDARQQTKCTSKREETERHLAVGKALQAYMNLEPTLQEGALDQQERNPRSDEQKKETHNKRVCAQQTKLKDHIIMSKQIKNYEKAKQINESQYRHGVGRAPPDSFDQFVLTRILNRPELIFNQNTRNDEHFRNRYFVKDVMNEWRLSLRDECFICDRHPYTLIFFERGVLAQNKELKEITDETILKELRYEFNKDFLQNRTLTPLIAGSFIKKEYDQVPFQRKLKMLRAPIFSLLALSQCKDFADDKRQVEAIKDGALKFLRNDTKEVMNQMHISNCFLGWQRVINDMVNFNELTSVHSVNLPDLSAYNVDRLDLFVFAGVFPPGYHQLMIYDPQQERAFCKDFVIQHNKLDQYPEYPTINKELGEKFKKIVSNVWVKWKEESQEDLIMVYEHMTERDNFIPQLIMNARDSQKCIQIIRKFTKKLMIFQKELLSRSKIYPLVSQQQITEVLLSAQQRSPSSELKGHKLEEKEIHQAFVLAQQERVDEETHKSQIDVTSVRGLNEGLNRTHLVKMITILAQMFIYKHFKVEDRISDYLPAFLEAYLGPTIEASKAEEQRRTIRASTKLNELFFDNIMGLKEIMNFARHFDTSAGPKLSKMAACDFFMELTKLDRPQKLELSVEAIERSFCQSVMPVIDEFRAAKKYDGLTFVEFLELIARIAMACFGEAETVEYKVRWLLEYMWSYMTEVGEWDGTEHPFQDTLNPSAKQIDIS